MIGNKKVVCIIPARLASTRFPRKMLARLGDKPLLEWVWKAATAVPLFDEVHFAVDTNEIAELVTSFGGSAIMTSIDCVSGTERLIEIMLRGQISSDIWVCWQGDEPFINLEMINDLLQSAEHDTHVDMWTLKKKINNPEHIFSPNYAKVVTDRHGHALYFSRSPIPFYRDKDLANEEFYKHVGIYAYSTQSLQKLSQSTLSDLEDKEKLEQLRLLEYGMRIRLHETAYEVKGIDTPQDLAYAESLVSQNRASAHRDEAR